jgi:hypothetical protein
MYLILVSVLSLVAPTVQATPDFSGTWVEDASLRQTTFKPPTGGPKSMVAPDMDLVVTQTPATLTSEMKFMTQVIRYVFKLDGKESVNLNGANTQTTKSHWDGKRLVTEGTSYSVTSQGESTWVYREVHSMNPKGQMVIEVTTTDEAGVKNVVTRVFNKK